jgi:hypothetical protein
MHRLDPLLHPACRIPFHGVSVSDGTGCQEAGPPETETP